MKSLVTGASGFIGSHLVDFLREAGHSVVPLGRAEGDVLNRPQLTQAIAGAAPDVIFHLAAQSLPGQSWADPQGTFRCNVEGTLNLLDAVRDHTRNTLVIIACSSAEYAPAENDAPIREDHPLAPSSPYGVSKLAVSCLAELYATSYGLRIIRARPFFWIGPRKTGDVCSDFARRIAQAERSGDPVLRVGNLEVVRDFLDIDDGIRGLVCLAERGQAGDVYNICSGHGYRVRDILERLKSRARIAIEDRADPTLWRSIDERVRIGDPGKLKSLGWDATVSMDSALTRLLEYWRSRSPE